MIGGTEHEIERAEGRVLMPFYVICDVSASMARDNTIGALNEALKQLQAALAVDLFVDNQTMLSVITFNHLAQTVVALDSPSAITLPTLIAEGGTNYGGAFQEFHRAFEADLDRLKTEGIRAYRPCVFFVCDGAPTDPDYLNTFRSLFGYDPETRQGNKRFPYVVTFGFGEATQQTMSSIAYPDFGATKGRWFLAKPGAHVSDLLASMAVMIANTMLSSGRLLRNGMPEFVTLQPARESPWQSGEAGARSW